MLTWNNQYDIPHKNAAESWEPLIDEWLKQMLILGRSEETIRTRWYQLSRFSRAIGKTPEQVTPDDVISLLGEGTLKLETKRSMRSAVKSFYAWAIERGHVTSNPAAQVPPIAMSPARGLICPEENVSRGVTNGGEDARLSVMLAAWMGLRRVEITRINLKEDLIKTSQGMRLNVNGKGQRRRILPVPARCATLLEHRTGVWLFPGKFTGHKSVDYIGDSIRRATGHPPHSLRRRFATVTYYRTKCNIMLVSRLLGHASVSTTMRYIGLIEDDMRTAVEAATATDSIERNPFIGTRDITHDNHYTTTY